MRILALDLGSKTGWALFDNGAETSGTWTLATDKQLKAQKAAGKNRSCDIRARQLKDHLESFFPVPDYVYFEDVMFASTSMQAHLWGGFRAIVSLMEPPSIIRAIPVGTLKKFATGHGGATKEMMASSLGKYREILSPERILKMDDNEVDAYWLMRFARKELGI